MYRALCVAALAGLACSALQAIDLDEIAIDFSPPELVRAPFDVISDIPPMANPAAIVPVPTGSANGKRVAACSPSSGTGPVPPARILLMHSTQSTFESKTMCI